MITYSQETWAGLTENDKQRLSEAFEKRASAPMELDAGYTVFWRCSGGESCFDPNRQYWQTAGGSVVASWTHPQRLDPIIDRIVRGELP